MGETAEQYRQQDAARDGQVQGLFGEPITVNPYKHGTGTRAAWDEGWRAGHKRYRWQQKGESTRRPR